MKKIGKTLGINCFVRDKDGNLIDRHTFSSENVDILRAAVDAFEFAINTYCKDYITVMHTPLIFLPNEEDE